eukprot:3639014-Pyramimonas_sp.AAC.1
MSASAMLSWSSRRFVCCLKAASREREVSTAEPMANPLPVAAVVLPRASRASVLPRTCVEEARTREIVRGERKYPQGGPVARGAEGV